MDVSKIVVVGIFVCLASGVLGCLRSIKPNKCEGDDCCAPGPTTASPSSWPCGYCGPPITMTLRVRNDVIKSNPFDIEQVMKDVHQQSLLYLFLHFVDQTEAFNFTMTYYNAELGMMVDAINGLKNNFVTEPMGYWKLLFDNGTALNVGVSNYFPQDGDGIVFEYTEYVPGKN